MFVISVGSVTNFPNLRQTINELYLINIIPYLVWIRRNLVQKVIVTGIKLNPNLLFVEFSLLGSVNKAAWLN